MNEYLSGQKLYGDDFLPDQIGKWFSEEMEGYYNLSEGHAQDRPQYSSLIRKTLADKVRGKHLGRCLALGPAAGHDLKPFAKQVSEFFCIEPAHGFWRDEIAGVTATYCDPTPDGSLAFADNSIDTAIAIGVLHHIPNVSTVVKGISRILKPGGLFLTREPIVTMGDWTKPRQGLTKHERGIPDHIFQEILSKNGLKILSAVYCDFAPIARVALKVGVRDPYESGFVTSLDLLASKLLQSNVKYHRLSFWDKLAPASLSIVAMKEA